MDGHYLVISNYIAIIHKDTKKAISAFHFHSKNAALTILPAFDIRM